MARKTNPLIVTSFLVCSLLLSGCSLVAQPADVATESPTTTITGKVTVAGEMISIMNNGLSTEITSRKIDLKEFDGKTVSVVGEFSGTTLYVDEVK